MGFHDNAGFYHEFRVCVPLPLLQFREAVAGDVGNIAGGVGVAVFTSDSTPALSGTASTVSQQLSWVTGNVDQILRQIPLPEDFCGKDDVLVELWVNSGTTDPASFSVLTNWDGAAADITDTADDAATKSATTHKITAVISKDDIPDNAAFLSIALVPPTHATNAIQLLNARMLYVPKVSA